MRLRDFQQKASDAVYRSIGEGHDPIFVSPTGTGKSVILADIIRRVPGRVMVMAHRAELIEQLARTIIDMLGPCVEVEMADDSVDEYNMFGRPRVVIASVQTLTASGGSRLEKFNPNDFDLLIIDECHHAPSNTYRAVVAWFKRNTQLRVVGTTATPDRRDNLAMATIFDDVPFEFQMRDAVDSGWLVPIVQDVVTVLSLDYSKVRSGFGDLNGADLARTSNAEKPVLEITGSIRQRRHGRKTLVFCVDISHAEKFAEVFNRAETGSAGWVCGMTERGKRKRTLEAFTSGDVPILCNVGVLTEGYDEPTIECVAMARATTSRALYAQMLGRGTRPLPGYVDGLANAKERRASILGSAKPDLLVLDYIGNCGKHKLINAMDILGGVHPDEVVALATRTAAARGVPIDNPDTLLDEAAAELEFKRKELAKAELEAQMDRERLDEEHRRSHLVPTVRDVATRVDPFDRSDVFRQSRSARVDEPSTTKQRKRLKQIGLNHPESLSKGQAGRLINVVRTRRDKGLCTFKQASLLRKKKIDPADIGSHAASEIIAAIAANNWRRIGDARIVQICEQLPPDPKRRTKPHTRSSAA